MSFTQKPVVVLLPNMDAVALIAHKLRKIQLDGVEEASHIMEILRSLESCELMESMLARLESEFKKKFLVQPDEEPQADPQGLKS